jgi:hypothetical protein
MGRIREQPTRADRKAAKRRAVRLREAFRVSSGIEDEDVRRRLRRVRVVDLVLEGDLLLTDEDLEPNIPRRVEPPARGHGQRAQPCCCRRTTLSGSKLGARGH